ncbi:hypothetical protein GN956_G22202 [Arapaima gigas]
MRAKGSFVSGLQVYELQSLREELKVRAEGLGRQLMEQNVLDTHIDRLTSIGAARREETHIGGCRSPPAEHLPRRHCSQVQGDEAFLSCHSRQWLRKARTGGSVPIEEVKAGISRRKVNGAENLAPCPLQGAGGFSASLVPPLNPSFYQAPQLTCKPARRPRCWARTRRWFSTCRSDSPAAFRGAAV